MKIVATYGPFNVVEENDGTFAIYEGDNMMGNKATRENACRIAAQAAMGFLMLDCQNDDEPLLRSRNIIH